MTLQKEMEELSDIVKNVFDVDIKTITHKRGYVDGRFAFAKIMLDRGYRLIDLGKYLKKHHSTIVHYRRSCNNLIETNPLFATKFLECRNKFMQGKEADEQFSCQIELNIQLQKLILENNALNKELNKHQRLKNIIEFIDSRTPTGKESYMLRKINLMFNGLTDYGQELEW